MSRWTDPRWQRNWWLLSAVFVLIAGRVFVTGATGFEIAQGVFRDEGGAGSPWDVFPLPRIRRVRGTMRALRILLAHLLAHIPGHTTVTLPDDPPAQDDLAGSSRPSGGSGRRNGGLSTSRARATTPPRSGILADHADKVSRPGQQLVLQ